MSEPEPRRPSVVPAAFALLLIAALALFVWLRRGAEHHEASPSAASTTTAGASTPQPAAAAPAAGPTSQPAPVAAHAAPSETASALKPEGEPELSDDDVPGAKAKKPKLTLDQKLELTTQHLEVMKTRATLLDKEIADAEAAGRKDEAAQKRVMLTRLNAHMDRLRAAVAEHRDPQ